MRRLLIGILLLGLAACGRGEPPPPDPDETTARTIAQGDLVGFRSDNGAQVWRGVAFAAPPVGDLRWRAPRPAPAFEGRLEALESPERCAQMTIPLDQGEGVEAGQLVGSEDCLYLDVYAPADAAPGDDLPVMVWIHGGGNTWGYAAQYDGAQLAEDQDVVVVAVQYRLGPLGWFANDALRADAATPRDAAANFALLDQIAALEWVRDNIDVFGGDAERVTIFGESAGGHNVYGLLASPLADGLFHRAIVQSGLTHSVPIDEAMETTQARLGTAFDAAPTAADLRAMELEALFAAYEPAADGRYELPTMIADGVTLPPGGIEGALASSGPNAPVITGTNRDETRLFNLLDERYARSWFGVLYTARDRDFYDVVADYQSRVWRIRAVDRPATTMLEAGHSEVWAYRFDWDEGGRVLFMDLGFLLGAAHGVDIPFVFNHFDFFGRLDSALFNRGNAEGRAALAGAMGDYWAEFARTGEPGRGGDPARPVWTRWQAGGLLMRFDSPDDGGPAEIIDGTDDLSRLAADLAVDERLEESERCAVAAAVAEWWAEDGAAVSAELGC
ncbi:carboxylesterase [Marinicauda salina]|uniref:Carboxylic ester hydrolase n=1 Tax=Marinicauda salina TaxID=2135793 RepID=A0A2U2BVQ2_9PROT|nr:carboxylesterase family protein [Marinicauda salina]PWE18059.1 carboxylesterase [Marinicauda salina]